MPNQTIMSKITFIGGGQMAEAMIGGLLSGQVCPAESIWATDPVVERRDRLKSQFGIRVGSAHREAASSQGRCVPLSRYGRRIPSLIAVIA